MSLLTSSSLSVTYISQVSMHFAIWLCYVNSNRIKHTRLCATHPWRATDHSKQSSSWSLWPLLIMQNLIII